MTPEEALQIVDQNLAQLNGTREAHVQLQQAIAILKECVDEPPKVNTPQNPKENK